EIILCHAQFIQPDRADIEKKILEKVGKHSTPEIRRNTIIIGTQVLEQSLDIDFDLLITELCPMDLLLQRMGRLHRHIRNDRPASLQKAVCRILSSETEFDEGSVLIYGEWLLRQTVRQLPNEIRLPADISPLVQAVYGAEDANDRAYQEYQKEQQEKRSSAKAFLLGKPKGAQFSMLLDRSVFGNDTEAEASVRDGISSVEVLVVMRTADGMLHLLPHQANQQTMNPLILPDDETCRMLASQKLRMPSALCQRYNLRSTVAALESQCGAVMKVWGMSPWLHGQLLLILDEGLTASVGTFRLTYDAATGLHYESEAKA
ncbi:MAG: CRISPR-associated helicase/endonuclease Cas3, partial [Oscillospiraceae bacterium]|nr:CRISPR-associated helicase/endonuclease Cas3 [Oscillospiraceae bacterium]